MTLQAHEFIRRFLMHVLPKGLPSHPPLRPVRQRQSRREHRQVARAARRGARAKEPEEVKAAETDQPCALPRPCPCCGGRMLIIETFAPGCEPKYRPHRPAGDQDRHLMMTCNRMLDAMPPLHDAGSGPAMRALAPMQEIDTPIRHSNVPSDRQLRASNGSRSRCLVIDHLCSGAQPIAIHHHRASRLNRHRARCTVGASSSATSCIAGLPTPAVGACGASVMAGIRKPLQHRTKFALPRMVRLVPEHEVATRQPAARDARAERVVAN